MAVKIRLKRLGKIHAPFYRIVVADSRTKRDGRVIEEIGKYDPNTEPSLIEIGSERAQYWLGVGAQPTEQVLALLKVTGDWQKFKGLPGAEGTLRFPEGKQDPNVAIQAAEKAAAERRAELEKAAAEKQAEAEKAAAAEAAAAEAEAKAAEAESADEAPAAEAEAADAQADAPAEGETEQQEKLTMLADALEHLVRGIVDHPDDVQVTATPLRRSQLLKVRVHPDDLGRVIGRQGRTARALRSVMSALSRSGPVRVDVIDVDRR